VYSPLALTDPGPESMLQVTAGFTAPVTVAVNWLVPEGFMLEFAEETLTLTGIKVTVADANLVESIALVAVTDTVC
jgi:hypothetical protein